MVKSNGVFLDGTDATNLHPTVAVQEKDIVLTKCRFGAFSTTPLRTVLNAHKIDTIVLIGLSTSGVILTTVMEAADMDYRIVVLSDGVHDNNSTVHTSLINDIFPRRADIFTITDWTAQNN